MKLKLDENGVPVLQDGKPVYVHDDGKEVAVDVPDMFNKITTLNAESKNHRLEAKKAKEDLAKFAGIEDPDAAAKALETVANLDAKKLIDAGEAEKVKAQITETYEAKLKEATEAVAAKESEIFGLMVGGSFKGSKFVSEKMIIPADVTQAFFGQHFKVEDGKVVAYDASGNRVLSREKPGEAAGFDEALEYLVSNYPNKDAILKGGNSGSGGGGGGAGGGGNPPSKKPSEMTMSEKSEFIDNYGLDKWQELVSQ